MISSRTDRPARRAILPQSASELLDNSSSSEVRLDDSCCIMRTAVPNSCFGGFRASENRTYHAQYGWMKSTRLGRRSEYICIPNRLERASKFPQLLLLAYNLERLSINYWAFRGKRKLWDQGLNHLVSLCWCGEFLASISQSGFVTVAVKHQAKFL